MCLITIILLNIPIEFNMGDHSSKEIYSNVLKTIEEQGLRFLFLNLDVLFPPMKLERNNAVWLLRLGQLCPDNFCLDYTFDQVKAANMKAIWLPSNCHVGKWGWSGQQHYGAYRSQPASNARIEWAILNIQPSWNFSELLPKATTDYSYMRHSFWAELPCQAHFKFLEHNIMRKIKWLF